MENTYLVQNIQRGLASYLTKGTSIITDEHIKISGESL